MNRSLVLAALVLSACQSAPHDEAPAATKPAGSTLAERRTNVAAALDSIKVGTSLNAAMGTLLDLMKIGEGRIVVKRLSKSETKEVVSYAYEVRYGDHWSHTTTIMFVVRLNADRSDGEIVQVTR